MLPALIIFLLTYLLMLALPQYRPFAALGGAALFLALGAAGLWDFTLMDAARAVNFNVLLMMAGTMGTVSLFIESRMPARLAELLIVRVPNVKWAVCMLALFAGVISAFVDNVAKVQPLCKDIRPYRVIDLLGHGLYLSAHTPPPLLQGCIRIITYFAENTMQYLAFARIAEQNCAFSTRQTVSGCLFSQKQCILHIASCII